MTIKEYAKSNNLSYSKTWRDYSSGKLKGYKNENGQIIIGDESTSKAVILTNLNNVEWEPHSMPLYEEKASASRTNKAASQNPTDRYHHIDSCLVPFNLTTGPAGYGTSDVNVRDAIMLCQKAYYGFSVFRNTIDLMAEFCVSQIYFKNGSKKSQQFFEAFWEKVNLWSIQDMYYRERFRSGNFFAYRIEGTIKEALIKPLNQTYDTVIAKSAQIPIRYVVLNPADINSAGNISFANSQYYKILSDYELERLRNPRTPEDEEVLKTLDADSIAKIKNKNTGAVYIKLDNKNIIASFYKKQSYESFAVPMGFPVLEDINYKKELRLMDVAIARTAQQAILLITMGAEPEKGGPNPKGMVAMAKLFENESVARVVISDHTTKAEFIIPQISDILDPKKYEVIDKDIAIGLNNVFLGQGEKFANQHSKIEIFIERLKDARQAFLNDFLIPEIKRLAENLGFKNYPTPFYEPLDLKNELEYAKIYTRLTELGVLTPEEGIEAIETGKLPTPEDSLESQNKFKPLKDKGLYEPLIGGKKEGEAGRPDGTTAPKSSKKIGPLKASTYFSFTKIKDNIIMAQKLQTTVEDNLKTKFKIKKLNSDQLEIANQITEVIISNEKPEEWEPKIKDYIDNPIDKNFEQIKSLEEIAAEHQTNTFMAAILSHSKV